MRPRNYFAGELKARSKELRGRFDLKFLAGSSSTLRLPLLVREFPLSPMLRSTSETPSTFPSILGVV